MLHTSCRNQVAETVRPLSLSLSYVSVCLPFPLYLCLLLPLFLFVRVTDILLTVEQGRGLPRTYRIYGCARGHPTECVDREVPPYIYGGGGAYT